jgi:ferritin
MDLLQEQFNKERMNAQVYESFANCLESYNWPGFAAWMRKASADELTHAARFAGYLIDRNQKPISTALEAPPEMSGDNPLPFFQAALQLEQENTKSILAIEDQSDAEDDEQTDVFLYSWAIAEQTRSERELVDALLELNRVGPDGLIILDREYGERAAGGG